MSRRVSLRAALTPGRHESGASAVEYGLILAGCVAVVILGSWALQTAVKGQYGETGTAVGNVGAAPTTGATAAPTPTTSSPAPTSSSPAPTSSSPRPTSTSPTPTPTPTVTNSRRTSTINGTRTTQILDVQDLGLPSNARLSATGATMSPDLGTLTWNSDGTLDLNPDNSLNGRYTTTVTYTYIYNGTVYTGTISVTINA